LHRAAHHAENKKRHNVQRACSSTRATLSRGVSIGTTAIGNERSAPAAKKEYREVSILRY
jgi:hypothetical protein